MPHAQTRPENYNMAIGSALAGMNAAAYQMLNVANSVASGNLDNYASDAANLELAKIQFSASEKVAQTQNDMMGALLDMSV